MLKRLAACIREYKKPTVITLALILLEAVIDVFIPSITADLVNRVQSGLAISSVIKTGALLVVLALVSLGCGGLAGYTSAKASAGFARNLRSDLFRRIQGFSFENIDKFSSASLVTRMTTDVNNVRMAFMMLIRIAVRSPLMFIFSITMAYRMAGSLATTFVIIIPVLVFGLFMISKKALPAFRKVFKQYDKLNESVEENVQAMRVVKGFSREEHEKAKFASADDGLLKGFTRAERIVALNQPLMQICLYFNMGFVLLVGSRMAISSAGASIGVGEISAMLTYGMQILMSLMMISMIYVMLTISEESARRIYEVLCEEAALKEIENPVQQVPSGEISFKDVQFKYSRRAQRYALSSINLHIPSGSTIGILGGTGVGKSSLVQLIPRLYDVMEGSVEVGGIDVRSYGFNALRSAVAMVLQKNQLFAGTIEENLRWGNENATQQELIEACKLAQADGFITAFPDGYLTHIEQGGTNVSGGQRQRLCIARALLKKPKILILDDSTSAVDTHTDALIREGLRSYIPETTKIIIAQRVSSVQDADMILVMDNGSIVDQGTHEQLLTTSQIYREVFEQQTKGGKDDAEA